MFASQCAQISGCLLYISQIGPTKSFKLGSSTLVAAPLARLQSTTLLFIIYATNSYAYLSA